MEDKILRHGAYLFLSLRPSFRTFDVNELTNQLGLASEFNANGRHPDRTIALARRLDAHPRDVDDASIMHADAVVHVAAESGEVVRAFCAEAARWFGESVRMRSGVVRPRLYTGGEMERFAYDPQVQQQSGTEMPNVFVVPMSKTPEWWAKDWMERHTYFLPSYDDSGHMRTQGHALAAAQGIPVLYRRTYKSHSMPAPEGEYDFLNYFECADSGIPVFNDVCTALRNTNRNPEWSFVREGPTWHGRRVPSWADLFN